MSWFLRKIGGVFPYEPEDIFDHDKKVFHRQLSEPTQRLLKQIYEGIDPSRIVDYHTHIVGMEQERTGCKLDPDMFNFWRHPFKYMKAQIFMFGCGLSSFENADAQYVDRLLRLIKHSAPGHEKNGKPIHGRNCILAFDQVYTNESKPDEEHTSMYIPNDYVYKLYEEHPNEFIPTCSVHPFRPNALEELDRCRKRGIKLIKWLPNSMNIDPANSDKRYDSFYEKVKELDMFLLIHVGAERSVTSRFHNDDLGNPLHLKRPLDKGVKVIAAHCATEGSSDVDGKPTENFDLFLRLMKDPRYVDKLFADISSTTAFTRAKYLPRLLEETELHHRLVFGSDYPVPAINVVVHTRKLVRSLFGSLGLITSEEKGCLDELYQYNPLIFDFACKRCLKYNGNMFPPDLFMEHKCLPVMRHN